VSIDWNGTAELHPTAALRACAGIDIDAASLADLEPRVDVDVHGWRLFWPSPNSSKAQSVETALIEQLGVDGTAFDRNFPAPDLNAESVKSLGRAAMDYLVISDFNNEKSAAPEPGHWLLVAGEISRPDLADLIARTNRHGTTIRAVTVPDGSGHLSTILHVRYDLERHSSLTALLDSGFLSDARLLKPYCAEQAGDFVIFSAQPPPNRALSHVANLYIDSPQLFFQNLNPIKRQAISRNLFACTERTLFDLRTVNFLGLAAFTPERDRPELRFAEPTSQSGLEELRRTLRAAERGFGVSLSLRAVEQRQLSDTELRALRSRIAILQRKQKRLAKHTPPRLRVARIPNSAFERLAAVLRSFHLEDLADGQVKYCRLSGAGQAKRLDHFIMYEATQTAFDPIATDIDTIDSVNWYEADPIWAAHYLDHAHNLILTPAGMALHPTPHSWEVDEFDEFVVDALNRWGGAASSLSTDTRRVLLFEHKAPGIPELCVTPIDLDDFLPIREEVVGWLNDVLYITAVAPDWSVAEPAGQAARAIASRSELMEFGKTARRDVDAALSSASQDIVNTITATLQVFSSHIRNLADQADTQHENVKDLEEKFASITKAYKTAQSTFDALRIAHAQVLVTAEDGTKKVDAEARTAIEAIDAVGATAKTMTARFKAKITRLELELKVLRQKLRQRTTGNG